MLDPHQHYLFADYPHGAFPLSQLLALTVRHLACWQGEQAHVLHVDNGGSQAQCIVQALPRPACHWPTLQAAGLRFCAGRACAAKDRSLA